MAQVTAALTNFSHPGVPHQHSWCMNNASMTIRERAQLAKNLSQEKSSLLLAVSEELESHEAAWSTSLPCQVCHGDANEANLMVNDAVDQVIGIIDFGDISYCWRVAEVAIAMTYMMLLSWESDPWNAGAQVLAGYTSHCRLSPAELAAVPLLIKARIALSLANGAYSVQADPGNAEYLLTTQQPGFHLLQELCDNPEKLEMVCMSEMQ